MIFNNIGSTGINTEVLKKPELVGGYDVVEVKYPKEQRKKAKCTTKDDQFKTTTRSNQYFTLYAHRLEVMRPILQERAKQKWPSMNLVSVGAHRSELNVKANVLTMEDKECVLVGALYKAMPLKPNVLREYSEEVRRPKLSLLVSEQFYQHPKDKASLASKINFFWKTNMEGLCSLELPFRFKTIYRELVLP